MNEEKIISVYCGSSIVEYCGKQLHPLDEVKSAQFILAKGEKTKIYSNSPDFVSAIKFISENMNINVQFYLDGVAQGNDIEKIFENFNESFKYLDLISKKINKKNNGK